MVAPRVEGSLVRAVWLGLTGPVALLPPAAAQLSARLHAGVVRYLFNGDSTRGGLGPGWNTTELYGAMSTTGSSLNSSLEIWSDVDRVRGTFLRYSASAPILPWPFPPFVFTFVDGDLGLNLGQGPDPSQPGRVANFAGRGVTHAGVGAGLELRSGRTPGVERTTIAVGFRAQAN